MQADGSREHPLRIAHRRVFAVVTASASDWPGSFAGDTIRMFAPFFWKASAIVDQRAIAKQRSSTFAGACRAAVIA